MPRLHSGVWKHFTPAIKDGKETFMCNYCSKTYTKNATKMQMHLDKCKEYSMVSQQSPCSDGSSSASIPVPSSSFLPSATPGGQFLIDSVDQRSQAYADECLARAVYATSSPLTLTDNIYWKRFFSVLRPAYCPPTREALSTHLLDCEYNRVQSQVLEAIRKAESVTIISYGWSDIKETGTVIYVVATPVPLFYKCTKTKEQIHTSTFIAEQLKTIINEVGPQKVFAVVTDDAPDMMAAWAQVEEAFPHISAIGCTACGIQQLFDDIVAQPSMKALCRRAEQVIRYFREQKVLAVTFECWQMTVTRNHATNWTELARPTGSECTGVLNMISSLLAHQNTLQELSVSPTLDVEASIRTTLQDAAFWKGLSSSRNLLYMIGNSIDYMKREDAVLSGVVDMFSQLRCHIGVSLSGSVLRSAEQKAVMASLDRCQEFCIKPIHTAAYMLDPSHVGQQTLSGEQINSAYYMISSLSHHLDLDEGKVLGSFARYSAKQGLWKGAGIWSSCQHVSASTWWKGLCSSEPLSAVACAILQIPPTAGACEQLRSRLCDTKKERHQGCLSADKAQKLVAVQANLNLLVPSDTEYAPLESEEEKKVLFQSETQ
ncbi:angiopoietin-1 isoform X1 [Anabas testudineus]|uniref:angiopoietin-1 isoform X1 n=1 Tax=Anabas testudineus TaxID=64144 RepID=UPI000E460877|nr:angiopoietin-1 isoform X1 [Anabas testudineus]XP_026204545.1 angiopoietin-1 isoform X1 [Anabas testudineus]XP_026204546.1 angiopoietin-1 isoform X1 [Anabas testudineus]